MKIWLDDYDSITIVTKEDSDEEARIVGSSDSFYTSIQKQED